MKKTEIEDQKMSSEDNNNRKRKREENNGNGSSSADHLSHLIYRGSSQALVSISSSTNHGEGGEDGGGEYQLSKRYKLSNSTDLALVDQVRIKDQKIFLLFLSSAANQKQFL